MNQPRRNWEGGVRGRVGGGGLGRSGVGCAVGQGGVMFDSVFVFLPIREVALYPIDLDTLQI